LKSTFVLKPLSDHFRCDWEVWNPTRVGTVQVGGATVIECVAVVDAEVESVTVSVTEYVFAAANGWTGFWVVAAVDESPKFQLHVYGPVPPEAVPLNETDAPVSGLVGVHVKSATNAVVLVTETAA
jgi:hypothetical protein